MASNLRQLALVLLLISGGFGVAGAQEASAPADPSLVSLGGQTMEVVLDRSASRSLLHLQEGWIQWMSFFYQDRGEDAERQVEELMASLESVGMERLPELALGAVARGVEAAHQGNFERAELAFAAAERLDPGRPETSFGRAVLAEERGQTLTSFRLRNQGLSRVFDNNDYRNLWFKNLVQVLLTAALLASAAFVLLLMARFGGGLFAALARALSPPLPTGLHWLAATALLLWPLALPAGLAWLLLYWSVLIWRYSSVSQRFVLGLIWTLAAVTPILIHYQERSVELQLAPPVRAMNALAEGRLYGGLFSDLGVLGSLLPTSPAVQQVFGDVHRMLGQLERSRDRYGWVLDREPENVAALVGVGNYYFRKENYGRAIEHYKRAIEGEIENAAAHFNLSQAYSESYLFDDHRRALTAARTADDQQVGRWISEGDIDRVVSINGGVERRSEILALLEERFSEGTAGTVNPYWSLATPFVALALALAFVRLGPREVAAAESRVDSPWLRMLVPGLRSTENGNGFLAFGSLLLVAGLLQLLMIGRVGYELPWGLDPALTLPSMIGLLGLLGLLAVRGWRALRMGAR